MKVLMGKKYDYIEPKLITQLVNEYGCWTPENSTQMFARYYEWIDYIWIYKINKNVKIKDIILEYKNKIIKS